MMKYVLLLGCLLGWLTPSFAQNSVLATGAFYKLRIAQEGIHKITAQDLEAMGVSLSGLNPNHIQLYGNVGGMLPQLNSADRPQDLNENALFISGAADGSFDSEDYILFYAKGADHIFYDEQKRLFSHQKNLYDDYNYYFLTVGTQNGKRITLQNPPSSTGQVFRSFDDFLFYEKEEFNVLASVNRAPGGSGRNWYGEHFDFQTEYDFEFDLNGIESNSVLTVEVAAMGFSTQSSRYAVSANGQEMGQLFINAVGGGTYDERGDDDTGSFQALVSNSLAENPNLRVGLSYQKSENNAEGYLDYIRINFERRLALYGNQTKFQNIGSRTQNTATFELENIDENTQVWDITQAGNTAQMSLSGNRFSVQTQGQVREFVAFEGSDFESPEFVQQIENQNLHGSEVPDLLLVTHPDFETAAQTLADFRRSHDKLDVLLVTTEQIFNEFSSGRQDVSAIRDFIRHLYLKDSNKFRYVLLMGDASYDYKDRLENNTNFVPIYEARDSFDPIYSYSSDDYYAFMDADEGEWVENNGGHHTLELGIGRLPVRSAEEAQLVVEKLMHYPEAETLGKWRNQMVFVADDGDSNIHLRDTEAVSRNVVQDYSEYDLGKLYVDAFPQEVTTGGKRSPMMQNLLTQQLEQGVLIVNYMGHGAESGWASENILDVPQINNLTNLNNLPLFVTATCEFGRFDNPQRTSGGELLILNPQGGGVGLVTTTRPVFTNTNFRLARAFYRVAFEQVNGEFPRLGDVLRQTKNNSLELANRNFTLLGDPSLRLNYPKENIELTSLRTNGQASTALKALDKVQLTGEVRNSTGIASDFDGTLHIKVYDKPAEVSTLGDESAQTTYENLESVIFSGQASVSKGKFEVEFVVPKDIVYPSSTGKISLYAQHSTQNTDANGFQEIEIGGSQTNNDTDNTPPQVALFLGEKTFQSGDKVPSNTVLLADLSDDTGINTTGIGIGHDLIAFLDGNEDEGWILNDFYQTEKDNFRKGSVAFKLDKLTAGAHTLTLRAWDTHNNATEATIEFIVEDAPIEIRNLLAYPNPLSEETFIRFEHNRTGQDLEVALRIYDAKGRLVKNITRFYTNSSSEISNLRWNATNNAGTPLSKGMYIYRLFVRSLSDKAYTMQHGKLILMR